VVELTPKTPFGGMAPLRIGAATLSELDLGHLTSVAPYRGRDAKLSAALKAAHGIAAPGPGRMTAKAGTRAIWFGQRLVLLVGPEPDPALAEHAALSDQSDGWACALLEGRDAAAVLARLTPLDLRAGVFKRGHTARTDLRQMMASVTKLGESAFQIMVFRAFARTLLHDLRAAMEGVAARGQP